LIGWGAYQPILENRTQTFFHPQTKQKVTLTIKGEGSDFAKQPEPNQLSLADLVQIVEALKKGQTTASEVPSADLQSPIAAVSLAAKAARLLPTELKPTRPKDAAEAAEIAELEKNDGNPVLNKGGN
jgi:hypothetical protein